MVSSNKPRAGARRFALRATWSTALLPLFGAGLLLMLVSGASAAVTAVPLGTATSFAVLAGSGISNTGPTTITGDLGTFPTTTVVGSASITANGANHAGDAVTQGAKDDLVTAYNTAAGEGPTNPIVADLGGQTLTPGVYNSASSIGLTGDLTLDAGGDPLVHPQPETYWGNVNPIGPRGVYDESKRVSEAFAMVFMNARGVEVRIARIFNTFGPRMRDHDGRAVPQFVTQALAGTPLTVYGDGTQTRSLCYVDDLIEGLIRLLGSEYTQPVNLGNPHEVTMLQLAEMIRDACDSASVIEMQPLPVDDPQRRCPDVSVALRELDWRAEVPLEEGLRRTIAWWRGQGR